MAFFGRIGNVLRQMSTKQVTSDPLRVNSSLFQAIRCMSSSKVFVGGVSYSTDDQSLKEAFARYGEVLEARVIMDRETGRSRGFAFVTYTSSEEASSAIQALDGQELHGRRVMVDYATERQRPNFGGDGYGGGGGGYGGGGYGGGAPDYANSGGAAGGYGGGSPGYNTVGGGAYGEPGSGNYNSTSNYASPPSYGGGSPSFSAEGVFDNTSSESGFASGGDHYANSHGSSGIAGFNSAEGEFQNADDEFGKTGDSRN